MVDVAHDDDDGWALRECCGFLCFLWHNESMAILPRIQLIVNTKPAFQPALYFAFFYSLLPSYYSLTFEHLAFFLGQFKWRGAVHDRFGENADLVARVERGDNDAAPFFV